MLSVVIPSRSSEYLQDTIDDLLEKAEGDIEVIVILDGYWPYPMLRYDKRVIILHHGTIHNSNGMRASINLGMTLARGEYVMKVDEHCMFDKGFDVKLAADCDDSSVVIPRRYRLDGDEWKIIEDGRQPVDYMYVEYPYLKPFDKTQGLHGAEWKRPDRADFLIDETPTMQGSCYFLKKTYWEQLMPNGMDSEHYGPFTQEAQEISMAAWLSGGRVIVNKKTWYAHMHKGKRGKNYGFSTEQYKKHCEWNERGRIYCINKWLYTKEYKYDFRWFINEKFPTMPFWKTSWEDDIIIDREKDYSALQYKDDYWLSNLRS